MDEPDANIALHARLLAFDPTAFADLCATHLATTIARLGRRYPHACPHLVEQSVHDAFLDHGKRPERYDPTRSPLPAYLLLVAARDLANALEQEARHHRKRSPVVELASVARNSLVDERPLELLVRREDEAAQRAYLRAVRDACTPAERVVLDLLLSGERATASCAAALGLDDHPVAEQEREVKRLKDRVMKRLLRGRARHGIAREHG